tara:strand:+ start:715 stop:1410 length:696 start_codon:yes stop_codon:yes gene_type:complete
MIEGFKNKNFFERIERKWIFNKDLINLKSLNINICRSKLKFQQVFSKRNVNSIYFDDLNLSSIIENLDGVMNKKKYRIRWYGDKKIISNCSLEIKEKKGFVCRKLVKPIKLKNKIFFNYDGINDLKKEILKLIDYKVNLTPVLSTHYVREYFLSTLNNQIRATLDYNISSHSIIKNQNLIFKKNFGDYIYEMKYQKKYENLVRNNVLNLANRYSKSSKYVNSAINKPIYFS